MIRKIEILAAGLSLLALFIRKNWTGPNIIIEEELFPNNILESKLDVLKNLVLDGESIVSTVEYPTLLYLSKTILENSYLAFNDLVVVIFTILKLSLNSKTLLTTYF